MNPSAGLGPVDAGPERYPPFATLVTAAARGQRSARQSLSGCSRPRSSAGSGASEQEAYAMQFKNLPQVWREAYESEIRATLFQIFPEHQEKPQEPRVDCACLGKVDSSILF